MFKSFVNGVAKVAAAIVMAVLVLAVIGYGVSEYRDGARRREAKPFEEVKIWTPPVHEALGMKLRARTKLVDGMLYVDLTFQGYPPYLALPAMHARNTDRWIKVEFLDHDGFKLFDKTVAIKEFTSIVGPDSKPDGLQYEFTQMVTLEDYKRWASVQVGWNVETKVPVAFEYLDPVVNEKLKQDHCSPGLSKAERLKRLAQYGTVRQTGLGEYKAGGRQVSYLGDGGEMYSCN